MRPPLIKHSSSAVNQAQGKFEYRYYDITNSYLALENEERNMYFYAPNTSEEIVKVGYFEVLAFSKVNVILKRTL